MSANFTATRSVKKGAFTSFVALNLCQCLFCSKKTERNWTALLYYTLGSASNGGSATFGTSLGGMMFAWVRDEDDKYRG